MINAILKKSDETIQEYKKRLYSCKELFNLTWDEIADILNETFECDYSSDKYRKEAYRLLDSNDIELSDKLFEIKKEKVKLCDERSQINALVRKLAREDTFKDVAIETAKYISNIKYLNTPSKLIANDDNKNKGILCIGDWHYGLEVDLYYNKYNTNIAVQRINTLVDKVTSILDKYNINELFIVNLGDMISGRIHLPLRINSRIDVVTQTIQVSEILAEMLTNISKYVNISYLSVEDNHSRVEPNKKESLQTESFSRVIDWYLRERLKNNKNIKFIDNTIDSSIALFNVFNYTVAAVHGDKDPQKGIVDRLNSYLQCHVDMIISAHRHHFSADENNNTEFYCNGSLIGQDQYASDLRLNSKPSQLMFICTQENISEVLYKIKL